MHHREGKTMEDLSKRLFALFLLALMFTPNVRAGGMVSTCARRVYAD